MRKIIFLITLCFAITYTGCQKQNSGDNIKQDSLKQQTTGKQQTESKTTNQETKKDTTKKTGTERIDNQDVSKEKSPVEAKYTVGNTSCEIKNEMKTYWVYWKDGHKNQLKLCGGISENKDNVTWCEHTEKDTATIAAFVFENWNHDDGVYFTANGKEIKVTREDKLK